ncbi:MAG: site-2 protease family protein, partial [Bacteroidetes bacterium]
MNKWSLYIGNVSGIKVFIHWTFIFLIAWIAISGIRDGENTATILYTLAFVLCIFVCVTLHELGHALMAKRFHYTTKDITLLPIGGMAR